MNGTNVTKEKLAAALKQWDEEAAAKSWAPRSDDTRFDDAARYLLQLIAKQP